MTSKSQLEKALEKQCCLYAEAFGWAHIKLDNAKRGWPVRLYLGSGSQLLLVEFKRPGEKPTKKQIAVHAMLSALGFPVKIIDDFDDFTCLITDNTPFTRC